MTTYGSTKTRVIRAPPSSRRLSRAPVILSEVYRRGRLAVVTVAGRSSSSTATSDLPHGLHDAQVGRDDHQHQREVEHRQRARDVDRAVERSEERRVGKEGRTRGAATRT